VSTMDASDVGREAVYGRCTPRGKLWAAVTGSAADLRGRLEALQRQVHRGADPDEVDAVRLALWVTHGWGGRG
jgi:hypothetical protein